MSLTYLEILNFRNLQSAKISPARDLNLITGNNAAGKTSLLESIYFLSVARSFRSLHIKNIIQEGKDQLRVIGKQSDDLNHAVNVIGIEKGHKHTRIRINGENVLQISRLANYLPIQLIHPEGHNLLEQGPKQRRKFLDWGVFHVEQQFLPLWQQFSHVLKQRNAAIRRHQPVKSVQLWDRSFVDLGNKISNLREYYLQDIDPYVKKYCQLLFDKEIELKYRKGWLQEMELQEALDRQIETDLSQGYTHSGPQRAEIEFYCQKRQVQNYFSRGQQKLLVSALRLAQIDYLKSKTNKSTLLLLDDIAAELDPAHRNSLIQAALATGAQLFITVTEKDLIELPENIELKVFHVEHGKVLE